MNEKKLQELPEKVRKEIDEWISKFPEGKQRSAIIGSLHALQKANNGSLTTELMDTLADYLCLPKMYIYEMATFYSMFQTKAVGKHEISGSDKIVHHIENRLNIKLGESTKDGKFFLKKEEECLAACTGAPMMMVNHQYIENLTIDKVDEVINQLERD